MARPGDVPDDIHAKVKVYAIENDLEVPEAYAQLSEEALLDKGEIAPEVHRRLEAFAKDKEMDKVEAFGFVIEAVLDEDGSPSTGTVIKRLAIEDVN